MSNWTKINESQYTSIWDYIFSTFSFHPHIQDERVKLPKPNLCFDISSFYNEGFREDLYEELHTCAVNWFRGVSNGDRLYALDWQHDCYTFTPFLPFEKDDFEEWLIPVFPNGDFYFFLTKDFKNGVFADGISLKIYLWGHEMISVFSKHRPAMLIV